MINALSLLLGSMAGIIFGVLLSILILVALSYFKNKAENFIDNTVNIKSKKATIVDVDPLDKFEL